MKPFQNKSGSEKQDLQRDTILLRERERERERESVGGRVYVFLLDIF
jgi:hypothetical protein